MSQVKKKQHYVWKKYLASWSNRNQIFTLLKSSGKIVKTNLEGVAQERFFYALEEYTEEEEIILRELIRLWSNEVVRPITEELFEMFVSYSKIKRALKNKDLRSVDTSGLDKSLALLKANAMENVHTTFESFGGKLIAVRKVEDLKFLDANNELLFAMVYVCFQYLRTKNMKETIKPIIPKYDYLSEKFLNIFPFIYAPGMADTLTYVKDIKFIFFDNQTDVDFITTDQPIINIKKHLINEKGNVAQLDFYYPITPKIAIVIHYQEQDEKYKYSLIDREQVNTYNQKMLSNARDFVFSNSEAQLEAHLDNK